MNPQQETLPRAEAQKDRGAPAKDAPPAEPPRGETPATDHRFRDWALI
jgi:hypothetical protein